AGRTTLTGEGLQHADGHSPLLAATNPAVVHYDPAHAYELAHIMADGLRRMYAASDEHPHGEDVIYYLTVYNEPVSQPHEPADLDVEGLLKGIYHFADAPDLDLDKDAPRVQLMASGVGFPWVIDAQRILAEEWGIAAELWSVTSWNELAREAIETEKWSLNHPEEDPRTAYIATKLADREGPVVAVSDYMRAVPLQIARWVPGDFHVLGTDGFGFADTRAAARRFFQVDAQSVVVQALQALALRGEVKQEVVAEAFKKYHIDDPTVVADVQQEGAGA
ncbi:MAG: pyruvate dehydrogenase (acetyl-transferring), homodimeric type, partial [Actinomycetota bacterium]|nr:pyruvate dehydrogenase (acetyl-transferring), homodimeric type [Actinomycetota bacterium]